MPDVIVAGGGIAGMRAAIAASQKGASVLVVTRTHPLRSYSVSIQDGINAPGAGDSPDQHAADTAQRGAEVGDAAVIKSICQEGPAAVEELDRMGMPYTRDEHGLLARLKLEGSTQARTAFADDMTGHILAQVLYEQCLKAGFEIRQEAVVVDLAIEGSRCAGVVTLDLATGRLDLLSAKAVVLATGGPRRLYEPSTASLSCSGDGPSLALRAGAKLVDMEFVEYYPYVVTGTRLTLSPILVCSAGFSPQVEGTVDLSTLPSIGSERFYTTRHRLNGIAGINATKVPVPIHPAMHRLLGGIAVDQNGATGVDGLFAAGGCAGTGFHGAQTLPGNILLESLVTGRRAGAAAADARAAAGSAPASLAAATRTHVDSVLARPAGNAVPTVRKQLTALMHEKAGPQRTAAGLQEAAAQVEAFVQQHQGAGATSQKREYNHGLIHHLELGHLLDVARAVIASAESRQETRGVHVRTDFPNAAATTSRTHVSWDGKAVVTS